MAIAATLLIPEQVSAYTINTTERGRRIRWAESTVIFQVDPAMEAMLPKGQVAQAIHMSLDAWRGYEGVPDIHIAAGAPRRLGHHGDRPTNGIYMPAVWNHDPDKLAITIVTYEMASGRLLDADVVVNPGAPYALLEEGTGERGQSYDLAAVMAHEIGHVLGLGESEDYRMATMWPYADVGDTHQRTLSADDEAGILDAYDGPPPLPAAGCAQMTVATGGRHAPPMWLSFVLLSALGVWLLRSGRALRAVRGSVMLGGAALFALSGDAQGGKQLQAHAVGAHAMAGHAAAHHKGVTMLSSEPAARARFSHAFHDASALRVGRVARLSSELHDGLITTRFEVLTREGERVELTLPGGEHDGIGQIVGHEPLPSDGAELLIEPQTQRYAFHAEGRVWGGALGAGPAIELP